MVYPQIARITQIFSYGFGRNLAVAAHLLSPDQNPSDLNLCDLCNLWMNPFRPSDSRGA